MDFAFTTLRIKVHDPNYVEEEQEIIFSKPALSIAPKIPGKASNSADF